MEFVMFISGLAAGSCFGFAVSQMITANKMNRLIQQIRENEERHIKMQRRRRPLRKKFFCPSCDNTIMYENTYDSDEGVRCPFCDRILEKDT